jgi:uncharacterized membrane protein YbaN (DUF454 family)
MANRPIINRYLRALLIACGTLFVALGVLGIFVPVLPTTPFLLLAAACYARSSQRFYDWLLSNRWFGQYIRDYREGRGLPLREKLVTLTLLWLAIAASAWLFVVNPLIELVLVAIAVGVSAHLVRLKTVPAGGPR